MKRTFAYTVLLLLFAATAWAGFGYQIVSAPVQGAPGGTTCSGNYGETDDGNANNAADGFTWLIRVSLGCAVDASGATFHMRLDDADTSSRQVVLLVYADNGSGTDPDTLIWQSSSLYNASWTSAQWITDTITEAIPEADYLWIGFHLQSTSTTYFYTTNTPARSGRTITNAGAFPDVDATWDTAGDAVSDYGASFYVSVP